MREVYAFLNRILAGCGVEREVQEASGLISSIIDLYGKGELDDSELSSVLADVCNAIVNLASKCGRSYTVEKCMDDLTGLARSTVQVSALREKIMKKLADRKRGGRETEAGLF